MRLSRLQLFDYRNFERLDLDLSRDVTVLIGDNAQGKSNLLEAVYLLATMRAVRAESDVQLVRRDLLAEVQPAARVVGHAETTAGSLKVEVAIVARPGANGPVAAKTVRINGAAKRISDAVGRLTAVLFTADDMDMIVGAPSLRRRFLDMMLSQVDPGYAKAWRQYDRVITQRNSLLKRIREGQSHRDELEFWDSELTKHGGAVLHRRAEALESLALLAGEAHSTLARGEVLSIAYRPRIDGLFTTISEEAAADLLAESLRRGVTRDVAAGMTLTGPHRDDVEFVLNGAAASGYASRAQQRTIALALRLAEARFLLERRGDAPLLLLDDILSEMDADRRSSVLAALSDVAQMLVTGTDDDRFQGDFASDAQLMRVEAGSVRPPDVSPTNREAAGG
jgi:DNA replication and repair protein RecF